MRNFKGWIWLKYLEDVIAYGFKTLRNLIKSFWNGLWFEYIFLILCLVNFLFPDTKFVLAEHSSWGHKLKYEHVNNESQLGESWEAQSWRRSQFFISSLWNLFLRIHWKKPKFPPAVQGSIILSRKIKVLLRSMDPYFSNRYSMEIATLYGWLEYALFHLIKILENDL